MSKLDTYPICAATMQCQYKSSRVCVSPDCTKYSTYLEHIYIAIQMYIALSLYTAFSTFGHLLRVTILLHDNDI